MVPEERGFNEERAATRPFDHHKFRVDSGGARGDRARLCTHRRASALVVLSRTCALHPGTGTHDVGVPDARTILLAYRPGPDRPSCGGHRAIPVCATSRVCGGAPWLPRSWSRSAILGRSARNGRRDAGCTRVSTSGGRAIPRHRARRRVPPLRAAHETPDPVRLVEVRRAACAPDAEVTYLRCGDASSAVNSGRSCATASRRADLNPRIQRFPTAPATRSELIERFGVSTLRAIATRALANGDDYGRALLRDRLEQEEL